MNSFSFSISAIDLELIHILKVHAQVNIKYMKSKEHSL